MDYAKEYDRMVEQSNKQQAQIEKMGAVLKEVCAGLAIVEKHFQIATKADFADAPFPLDPSQAHIWHQATASAYQHALEMCGSDSLRAFADCGSKASDSAPALRTEKPNSTVQAGHP